MTSVGEAKLGEKQSRQSNSKYNFMQYRFVFFEKRITQKVFYCKLREKMGLQDILVAPQ